MTAGYNLQIKVTRYTYGPDDEVGGAMPTGTVIYTNIEARTHTLSPTQAFLDQGIETERVFRVMCRPASLIIYNRDEVTITKPVNHKLYNKPFTVMGEPIETNFHPSDPRGYLLLNLARSERAHDR